MATAVAKAEMRQSVAVRLPERLPDLKGKWLTLYSVLWAAALLIAVVAPIRTAMLNYQGLGHPVWRPHGLVTATSDTGITISAVFGDEARSAGVRAGDRVIAVDGLRLSDRSRDDQLYKLLDGPEGSTDTLTLRAPSGAERQVRLSSRSSTAAQMFRGTGISRGVFDAAVHFFDFALLLFLVPAAVLLFVRRRREIIPALLSISFLIISGFVAGRVALTSAGVSDMLVAATADLLGWTPLVIALVTFPNGQLASKWPAAAVALLAIAMVNDLAWAVGWFGDVTIGLAFVIAGWSLVVRYRRIDAGPARQQLRWAFLGFFVGISLFLVIVSLLAVGDQLTAGDARWAVWLPVTLSILAGLSFPCMALGLMVSVLRYRLYDADTFIGRSAAYGVLTLGFIGLFGGAEKLAELVGERYFEHSIGIAAGAVGAAVAAVCIVPLHNRIHRWAERRFQKPLIRLRDGLPECVADLRESAPVEQLVSAVMTRIEAGVRSTCEAVLLVNDGNLALAGMRGVSAAAVEEWQAGWQPAQERILDCDRRDPAFPLRVRLCIETSGEPVTIGWLLLGPRPDGSFFGKDEREALAHIAGPVARAIHIVQLRERREADAERRLSALETLVDKVASAIGGGRTVAPA